MLVLLESSLMCVVMLVVCIVGLQDGPERFVTFYARPVQERVLALGYTTREEMRRKAIFSVLGLFVPELVGMPLLVYFVNRPQGFWDAFCQLSLIYIISGCFDRLFIDGYWVGHTKAWFIPGTEDLMPYISRKEMLAKWIGTLVLFPLLAAGIAGVAALF